MIYLLCFMSLSQFSRGPYIQDGYTSFDNPNRIPLIVMW